MKTILLESPNVFLQIVDSAQPIVVEQSFSAPSLLKGRPH